MAFAAKTYISEYIRRKCHGLILETLYLNNNSVNFLSSRTAYMLFLKIGITQPTVANISFVLDISKVEGISDVPV